MQYIRAPLHHHTLNQPITHIIYTNHKTDSVTRNSVLFLDRNVVGPTGASMTQTTDGLTVSDWEDTVPMETARTSSPMDRPDSVNADHVDDSVLQISGAGHWFLEGWVGDHSV